MNVFLPNSDSTIGLWLIDVSYCQSRDARCLRIR